MPVLRSCSAHVKAKAEQFARPGAARAEALQRAHHRPDRPLVVLTERAARVSPRDAAEPPRLLSEMLEEVSVLLERLDPEAAGGEVVAVPVAAEAGLEVERRKVR